MINEIITNCIQGEGLTQGQSRQLIRMNKCNLRCSFCDSAYTWGRGAAHVKLPKKLYSHIIISGGEPTLPENLEFIQTNILNRKEVSFIEIETNGTYEIKLKDLQGITDYIDLWNISPKRQKDQLNSVSTEPILLKYKDYLRNYIVKFVVDADNLSAEYKFIKKIQKRYMIPNNKIWLMPLTNLGENEWTRKNNSEIIYDFCAKKRFNFSARLHVLIKNNERGI